jgi:hypothetical protein
MVATRSRHDARHLGLLAPEPVRIDQPTAHLECADRRVILMLYEHVCAGADGELRPRILRRRRHSGAHDRQCGFDLGNGEQG